MNDEERSRTKQTKTAPEWMDPTQKKYYLLGKIDDSDIVEVECEESGKKKKVLTGEADMYIAFLEGDHLD